MKGAPRTTGRLPIITQQIITDILSSLKAGCYIETAAAYAGISKDSLYNWLKRGRREKRRLAKNPRARPYQSEAQFVIFVDGVTKAMSESEVRDVSIIAQAANGGQRYIEEKIITDANGNILSKQTTTKGIPPQWQAAAWRLERKYPKKWGRRVAIRKDEGNGEETAEEFAKKMRDEFGTLAGILGCGDESQNDPTCDTTDDSDESGDPKAVLPANK